MTPYVIELDDGEWFTVSEGLMVKVVEEPHPEIPPPCWDEREISADKCRAATLALCG